MSMDVLGFSEVCQKKIRVPLVCRAHELGIASLLLPCMYAEASMPPRALHSQSHLVY